MNTPPGYFRDDNGTLWKDIKWKPWKGRPATRRTKRQGALWKQTEAIRKKG